MNKKNGINDKFIQMNKFFYGDKYMDNIDNSDSEEIKRNEAYKEEVELTDNDEKPSEAGFFLSYQGLDLTVDSIVNRFNKKTIYIPGFQRNFIWSAKAQSRFIESILLGLPIPSIFLYRDKEEKLLIIDGLQRISTLRRFISPEENSRRLKLSGIDKKWDGKFHSELEDQDKRKIDNTSIHTFVIKADEPIVKNYQSVYEIFERLNNGGVKLSPQEIRNCIYHGDFLTMISELSKLEDFNNLIKISPSRKKNEELCLRFIALKEDYENYSGNMKEYLNDFMNNKRKESIDKMEKVKQDFTDTLSFLIKYFDIQIFKNKEGPAKLALLDSVFVSIMIHINILKNLDKEKSKKISKQIADFVASQNEKFEKHISIGTTHNSKSVKGRINLLKELISKAIS